MEDKIKFLLKTLEKNGFASYVVGGYVRDLYLGKPSSDIDICTSATPFDLKRIFAEALLPRQEYGSVTLVIKNVRFEITTFRIENKYLNNRKPENITYTDDILTDLYRRDFTINTICLDSNLNYVDFLGGLKDIDARLIKTPIDPFISMETDSLRILRAIRFATVLDFKIDVSLKEAIKKNGYLLRKLSFFRKKSELDKIFNSKNAFKGIALIKELELEKYLDLDFNNLKPKALGLAIWAQVDTHNLYPFTKIESTQIKNIRELISKNSLDKYNLYTYGLYLSQIAGEVKGLSKEEVARCYQDLPIKSRSEIAISALEIITLLKIKPQALNKVFFDLEHEILYNKLNNVKLEIEHYLLEKYSG